MQCPSPDKTNPWGLFGIILEVVNGFYDTLWRCEIDAGRMIWNMHIEIVTFFFLEGKRKAWHGCGESCASVKGWRWKKINFIMHVFHTRKHRQTGIHTYICRCLHEHTYMHKHIYIYMCVCVCVCVYIYIYIHIYIYIFIYLYIYIYTHTLINVYIFLIHIGETCHI